MRCCSTTSSLIYLQYIYHIKCYVRTQRTALIKDKAVCIPLPRALFHVRLRTLGPNLASPTKIPHGQLAGTCLNYKLPTTTDLKAMRYTLLADKKFSYKCKHVNVQLPLHSLYPMADKDRLPTMVSKIDNDSCGYLVTNAQGKTFRMNQCMLKLS